MSPHGSHKTYIIGFILSVSLTLAAYLAVVNQLFSVGLMISVIVTLAVAQLFVQLVFFLHLGQENRPRWNLLAALFAGLVVLIVVFGSLWIMKNLDYHMTPAQQGEHMIDDEGISH